jgi:hypothetical protein
VDRIGRRAEGLRARRATVLATARSVPSAPPGGCSQATPECERPDRPVEIGPGQIIAERWELPLVYAYGLDAVGSGHTLVRAEIVESRTPDRLEYLDMLPTGEVDEARTGRGLRVEVPASGIIDAPASRGTGPRIGEVFDRLLERPDLRAWVTAQLPGAWREGRMTLVGDVLTFKAISTAYARAAVVQAQEDGTIVSVELPGEEDRTHLLERLPAPCHPGSP